MDKSAGKREPADLDEAKKLLREAETAIERLLDEHQSMDAQVHLRVREFAHDIKNALSGAIGFSQLMKNGVLDKKQIEKHSETIHRSASRAVEICNAMLHASDPDGHPAPDAEQDVKVGEIVEEVCEMFGTAATERGVKLQAEVSPDFPPINTVPQHVYRALTNIVTNALKFTPEGGNIAVKADLDEADDAVVLVVRDSGEGIPADQIMEILKPGVTTMSARGDKGTGLGLPIVAQLVKELGGTVGISSRPGHGTAVTLKFPKAMTR